MSKEIRFKTEIKDLKRDLLKKVSDKSVRSQLKKNTTDTNIFVLSFNSEDKENAFQKLERDVDMTILNSNSGDQVYMLIKSPGGSVTAGLAIYDTMQMIRCDVRTYCIGQCASMGAWLLAAGQKGKRYCLPNSRVMIHQPLGGATGQATDIAIQAEEIIKLKVKMTGMLADLTGQKTAKVLEDIDRDFFMSAEEAKAYGLVDEVVAGTRKEDPAK